MHQECAFTKDINRSLARFWNLSLCRLQWNKNEWEKAYLSCRVSHVISTLKRCISTYFIISWLSTSAIFSECFKLDEHYSLRNVIWKSRNKINFCMKLFCDRMSLKFNYFHPLKYNALKYFMKSNTRPQQIEY